MACKGSWVQVPSAPRCDVSGHRGQTKLRAAARRNKLSTSDDLARLQDGLDRRVVRNIGQKHAGPLGSPRGLEGFKRRELEVNRRHIRPVDSPVNLGSVETPGLYAQRDVSFSVVVVVERRSLGGGIQDGEPNHSCTSPEL